MASADPWILDTTSQDFQRDVVEHSTRRPVLVDFWAPWCGPCKQLGPLIEKVVNENNGRVALVKVNVEDNQDLAGAFGIQSIPLVVAFQGGQPVDQFMGLMGEDELRDWVARLIPAPEVELVSAAAELEQSDPVAAESKYREALTIDADLTVAKIGIARILLGQSRFDESRQIIDELEARGYLEPEADDIKSQLDVHSAAAEAGGVEQARQAAAANPEDVDLQLQLADALASAGKHREALEIGLQIVSTQRDTNGPKAKDNMVKIFTMLGNQSELVGEFRRKLATALY